MEKLQRDSKEEDDDQTCIPGFTPAPDLLLADVASAWKIAITICSGCRVGRR
jgi:hypothetical protein